MISRRNVLQGIAGSVAGAFLPAGFARAAKKEPSALESLYLFMTREAYQEKFQAVLTDDKVADYNSLITTIENIWPGYKATLIEAAKRHIAEQDAKAVEGLKSLSDPHRNGRGLFKPLDADGNLYTRNGRQYSEETAVQSRTGDELTNPLFLRIHDLSLKGKITRKQAIGIITQLAEASYDADTYTALKEAFNQRRNSVPAEPEGPRKLKLP